MPKLVSPSLVPIGYIVVIQRTEQQQREFVNHYLSHRVFLLLSDVVITICRRRFPQFQSGITSGQELLRTGTEETEQRDK